MPILSQSDRVLFNGTNINATAFTYNSDSWLDAKADNILLQVDLATLNATNLTYRLESRSEISSRTASIHMETLDAVTSIGKLIEVSEKVNEVRLGVKISGNTAIASPNNFYANLILTEMR